MKNIFWIASYPKSGNTLVRLFLSSYFFTDDGKINDFNMIKNITIFNNINIFNQIKNLCDKEEFKNDPSKISKYWIAAQQALYKNHPNKVFFLKTHNSRVRYKGNYFTNEKYTRGFIYVVRDPRSVIVSAKNHYNYKSYDKGLNDLFSDRHLSLAKWHVLPEFLLSWKTNYLSWKEFLKKNSNIGLIVKFEDLIKKPDKTFLKIINFIKEKHEIEFSIKKFNNAVKSVRFDNLQKIEKRYGFDETGSKKSNFFRKGIVDEWKTNVPKKIISQIEKKYYNEMKDLGYL